MGRGAVRLIPYQFLRNQNHLLVVASGWGGKVVTALLQLVSIPLIINVVGLDQYAVFALLLALAGWFALVDFGLGASLQNFISECRVKGVDDASYRFTALVLLLISLVCFVCLAWFFSPLLGPLYLKGGSGLSEKDKTELFFMASLCAIASGIGATSYKIWYAKRKGYWSNLLPPVLAIVALGGVGWIGHSDLENKLIFVVAVYMGLNGLVPIALLVALTILDYREAHLTWHNITALLHRGGHFFYFGILAAITLQADYLIISQVMNHRDIVLYNIATKIFGMTLFLYNSLLVALWPVLTELLARNNWDRVFFHIKWHIVGGMTFIIMCTALLVIAMPNLVELLLPQEQMIIPISLILLLGFYQVIRVWTDTFALILNSMSSLKPFFVLVPIQAVLSVILQIAGARRFGLNGLVMGIIASFLFTVVWGLPWYVWRYYRDASLKTVP